MFLRRDQYEEGEAFLRMKGVLTSDNPAMWDTVFYRIKYSEHPHSGRCEMSTVIHWFRAARRLKMRSRASVNLVVASTG